MGNPLLHILLSLIQADLATFTMTLINKTLFGIPDQDTFYDQTDYMEEGGIEDACQKASLMEVLFESM